MLPCEAGHDTIGPWVTWPSRQRRSAVTTAVIVNAMITLHLLGPVDVRACDGSALRAALAQTKRLALLAYLAAAKPRGFHTRDRLVALLWPELDQVHARAALRQALYALRRALGDDVFVGCGDSVLAVNPDKLWCDTAAFDDAINAGDSVKALSLYRAEAFSGFHLSNAPEFERWLDGVRAHYATGAAAAAGQLADATEREGDSAAALLWTRRLLEIAPDDECAVRRTITLLYRIGDRARAIRVYEDFARRIEMDYDLEPSPGTRALIRTVRAAELGSAPMDLPGTAVVPSLAPLKRSRAVHVECGK